MMQLEALRQEFDTGVPYPPYYLQPFHAYDQGNLNWLAAYEVQPASYAMALRTFKTEQLTPDVAMTRLRENINREIVVRQRATQGWWQGQVAARASIASLEDPDEAMLPMDRQQGT